MNIGSLLGDMNFWSGVGEGFMTETNRQRDLKEKNYRELRNYGIESGLQIREENNAALDATEAEVKKVASLIAGDRAVSDKAVREAALYLINQEGSIDGAQRIAKKYSTEHSTYGRDPIAIMGLTERTDGETPDYRGIARTYTKLKPLPDISATSGATEQTALDVIFGGETATEMAQKDIESIVGQTETQAAFTPVSGKKIDEQMILSADFGGELKRMRVAAQTHDLVPLEKRDEDWYNKQKGIAANINMLEKFEEQQRLKNQKITYPQRKSFEKDLMTGFLKARSLNGDWDANGNYLPTKVKGKIYTAVTLTVAKQGEALQWAVNGGYFGKDPETGEDVDPYTFILRYGTTGGKNIIIVADPDSGKPHLSVGDDIFSEDDMNSQDWKDSLKSSIQTPPPPNNTTSTTTSTTSTTTAPTTTTTTSTTSSQVQIPLQMQGSVANNVKDYKAAPDTNSKGKIINRILKLKIPGLTTTKEVTDWLATQ